MYTSTLTDDECYRHISRHTNLKKNERKKKKKKKHNRVIVLFHCGNLEGDGK